MAFGIQALGSFSSIVSGTSLTNNNLTVASGATALLVTMSFVSNTLTPQAVAVTWGGTSMASVASVTNGTIVTQFYGLVNPALGNLTISATWTNAVTAVLEGVSFIGTAMDIIGNVFVNPTSNVGSGGTASLLATSAPGHFNFSQVVANGSTISTFAATGSNSVFNQGQVALSYDVPTSTTATWSGGFVSADPFTTAFTTDFGSSVSGNPWAVLAIDIVAAFTPFTNFGFQALVAQ